MAFTEVMNSMRENLQRSLDELTSPRSSLKSKILALQDLERILATASFSFGSDSQDEKDAFFALQYTFECNVPSRLLPWIMATTLRLEALTNSYNKGQDDDGTGTEIEALSSQLAVSLTLIQGVTLNHEASKTFMGRKPSFEILLDLLLTSRHLTTATSGVSAESSPTKGSGGSSPMPPQPPLTSLVLDTLLCILVDSSPALRAFEEANGVQSIVKILKRAGTPREVRMKCLEFLYFYLLDETPNPSSSSLLTDLNLHATQLTPPPTAPATPERSSSSPSTLSEVLSNPKQKTYMNSTPLRPSTMSRYGSSSFSFSTSTSTSCSTSTSTSKTDGNRLSTSASSLASVSTSSRSTSGSSMHSFSSTSSNASSSTAASSMPASPIKECFSVSGSPLPRSQQQQQQQTSVPSAPLAKSSSNLLMKSPVKRAGISNKASLDTPPSKTATNSSGSGITTATSLRRQATHQAGASAMLPRSLMMLRKEVEFVPLSPKKSPHPVATSSSSSSTSTSTVTPGTPASERLQSSGITTPGSGPGSGSGIGIGTKLVPRSRSRAIGLGHRKSLSTSTLTGPGFGSPAGERERTRIGLNARVHTHHTHTQTQTQTEVAREGSLPNIPFGMNGVNGGGGEDTDVEERDRDGEREDKDVIALERHVFSSSSSSSSTSTSSAKDRDGEKEGSRERERERDREWKTTEEKKELLGTMLGNVDALVEGVRKAGIWGLG